MEQEINIWTEVVNTLIAKNFTIATMESCTGGGIASEITNISGASAVLKESYVTYCNEAKIKQSVPAWVIEKYTVYSEETANEMALAAKRNAGANIGVGVTGQLGRIDPNNPVDTLNSVWFAVADQNGVSTIKCVHVLDIPRNKQKAIVISNVAEVILDVIKEM